MKFPISSVARRGDLRRSPGQDPRKDLPGMKRDAFDDLLEGSGRPGFGGGPLRRLRIQKSADWF